MESQAAFVMIGLLYLACTLVEVTSVKYTGDSLVRDGQPWNITCSEVPAGATIMWKRNGQPPYEDLASGNMHVETSKSIDGFQTSTLVAMAALERHEGSYSCAEGNETYSLAIIYDITIKVLTKNDSRITLECSEQGGEKVEWFKDKKPLVESSNVKVDKSALVLTWSLEDKTVFGNYSCKVGGNVSTDYRVVRKPTIALPESTNVVEGEKLHLTCAVKGLDPTPGLKVRWIIKGEEYQNSKGRVRLSKDEEKNVPNAILNIESITMDDKGNISCIAFYNIVDRDDHVDQADTLIRVKDKYAALWPFLGIVAEVLVLCLIILIYEKKRNKSELEESDTDQSPDTKPSQNKDSDVRHRK